MPEPEIIWVRSIKFHTYWNIPRDPDTFYQVDTQQDADTLVALKFAVCENPPAKAKRPASATSAAAPPPNAPTEASPAPAKPAAIMTTADLPKTTPHTGPLIDGTKR